MTGPPTTDPAATADWLELACLAQERGLLRHSQMERLIGSAAPDMDEADVETLVNDVMAEVNRRSERGGRLYPFRSTLYGLERQDIPPGAELLYRFLLLCSLVPRFRKNQKGFQPGRIFERVAANALERFTGGRAVVFADIDKSGVRERIAELGRMLYLDAFPAKARKSRKDHGLDVASWRSFPDRRSGQPIVLCQCTLKKRHDELIVKAREVSPGEWGGMLDVRQETLTAAVAIPHALEPGYEHWDELRKNTDLILDRTRLLGLLDDEEEPWAPVVAGEKYVAQAFERWVEQERTAGS